MTLSNRSTENKRVANAASGNKMNELSWSQHFTHIANARYIRDSSIIYRWKAILNLLNQSIIYVCEIIETEFVCVQLNSRPHIHVPLTHTHMDIGVPAPVIWIHTYCDATTNNTYTKRRPEWVLPILQDALAFPMLGDLLPLLPLRRLRC